MSTAPPVVKRDKSVSERPLRSTSTPFCLPDCRVNNAKPNVKVWLLTARQVIANLNCKMCMNRCVCMLAREWQTYKQCVLCKYINTSVGRRSPGVSSASDEKLEMCWHTKGECFLCRIITLSSTEYPCTPKHKGDSKEHSHTSTHTHRCALSTVCSAPKMRLLLQGGYRVIFILFMKQDLSTFKCCRLCIFTALRKYTVYRIK